MSIENKPQKITLTKESKLYFLIILIQKIIHFLGGGVHEVTFLSEKWGVPSPPQEPSQEPQRLPNKGQNLTFGSFSDQFCTLF